MLGKLIRYFKCKLKRYVSKLSSPEMIYGYNCNGILLKEYVDIFLSTIQGRPKIIFKGRISNKIMKSNLQLCLLPIDYHKELSNHFNAEI